MNRKEIIDWERNNRSLKNVGYENGIPKYETSDNRNCAIGRLLPHDHKLRSLTVSYGSVNYVFDDIPLEVRTLGFEFLCALQGWHDTICNFVDIGLSAEGEHKLNQIEAIFVTLGVGLKEVFKRQREILDWEMSRTTATILDVNPLLPPQFFYPVRLVTDPWVTALGQGFYHTIQQESRNYSNFDSNGKLRVSALDGYRKRKVQQESMCWLQ